MNYKKCQSKSLFIWGTLATISLSFSILEAANEKDAGSTIAAEILNQNKLALTKEVKQEDVQALQEELQKKTKELQEYKVKLFRPSHPDDQARIIALSRRISEYEKTKQMAEKQLKSLNEELLQTHKKIEELEKLSLAQSAIIENKEALSKDERAAKLEFAAKMSAFEREWHTEKDLTTKLQAEMVALHDLLALREKQITMASRQRDEELENISSEASLLKAKVDRDIHALKAEVEEITNRNIKLQNENELLTKEGLESNLKHEKHIEEKQSFGLTFLEQEEALSQAIQDYQIAKDLYADQIKSLSEELREQEQSLLSLLNEKSALDEELIGLKNRIDVIENDNARLQSENGELTKTAQEALAKHDIHAEERQSLVLNLLDQETALNQARQDYKQAKDEFALKIKSLTDEMKELAAQVAHLENENKQLNETVKDALSKHEEHSKEMQSHTLSFQKQEEELTEVRQKFQEAQEKFAAKMKSLVEELNAHEENLSKVLDEKNAAHNELEALILQSNELAAQVVRLENENKQLHEIAANKHEEHTQEKQAIILSLLKHEEALSEAKQDFQNAQEVNDQERQSLKNSLLDHKKALTEASWEHQNAVDSLRSEIYKLKHENSEISKKRLESERAVNSLTLVAQEQDQTLADASAIFSRVQEYNRQLEEEVAILKGRLNEAEAEQQKLRKSQESSDATEPASSVISKALMNLIQQKP